MKKNINENSNNKKIKKNLIILSIPFQRIIQSHLSRTLLEEINNKNDILIVSPFANNSEFLSRYKNDCITHLSLSENQRFGFLSKKINTISLILRVHGYYLKNKNFMKFYWYNRHTNFGKDGNDTSRKFLLKLAVDTISLLGFWRINWLIFDNMVGHFVYPHADITRFTKNYDRVTLVQSSSWGFQDQILAWMARKNRWRSFLIPYTTDQIYCNGYLFNDYHGIFVQGPAEEKFAKKLHGLRDDKIVEFGSLNIYNKKKYISEKLCHFGKKDLVKKILIVGSSFVYHSSNSEFECIEHIIGRINDCDLGDVTVVYRPLAESPESRRLIEERFKNQSKIEIRFASEFVYGLYNYVDEDPEIALKKYLESISDCTISVMIGFSSIAIDLTIFGIPSISYFDAMSPVYNKRKYDLLFNDRGELRGFENIKCVFCKEELVSQIKYLLLSNEERELISRNFKNDWDFSSNKIQEYLKKYLN